MVTIDKAVIAIDPTTSGVSLARIVTGERTPRLRYVEAPEATTKYRERGLVGAMQRAEDTATGVLERVLRGGAPDLVVMSKLVTGELTRDPSGPRRSGLWWEIIRQCEAAGIPVADYPSLAAQRYFGTHAQPGLEGANRLVRAVKKRWPGVSLDMPEAFRYTSVALAAIGCAVVGIPTAIPVTQERLKLLKTGTWAPGTVIPRGVEGWKEQHGCDTRIAGIDDDEDADDTEEKSA
ncbi:hypothetical protein KIH27_03350 [Mycobacterium sp. M1]|uniref:Uncharacterized protein n=1 Tax=Mycolicibacter acidiphilus TaxID=2835306 RepID=A0ABS5REK1_9MYCO|nr:hypothetical protein [Mycolicibacter acidiphilus]MBS9532619.1 hypothetical protein [Mycolicibacter acidiphilus]